MTAVLPVGDYHLQPAQRSYQYVSPDGTTFISAGQDFVNGALSWGVKSSDLIRTFGLARAVPGKPYYITDESALTTWSATVGPDGNLSDRKLFADQGGEGVAVDERGNVYIAAGQIYVYDPAGKLIDTIEVPERPLQLVFGGKDGQTLFIPARTSLYAVRTRVRGL
jgi:sugar lactone lactonase YvrE